MNERDALFANVLNGPADDTARLVLADWLDEQEGNLARFIRAGVIGSQFRAEPPSDDPTTSRCSPRSRVTAEREVIECADAVVVVGNAAPWKRLVWFASEAGKPARFAAWQHRKE